MRRNIFLHFLNRDTREIFDLYKTLTPASHALLMRRALNAAAIICEEHCVAPPGFVVEDQIAFDLAENQRAYLQDGLIQLPMRESNLAEFAEKKRIGYEPMRDRYSGLFNDTRIGFLGDNATGIVNRKTHITERILADWTSGPESGKRIWLPTKKILPPAQINLVAKVPIMLDERGTALTWAAIQPELPPEALIARAELRDTLQHVYFRQYCEEFDLFAITGIPHVLRDFGIPTHRHCYNYRWLGIFLEIFELRDILLDAPADLIVALRRQPGFIAFIDAFVGLATISKTETYLKFFAGQARDAIRYSWNSLKDRGLSLYNGSYLEINELASVMAEIAAHLTVVHDFPTRIPTTGPILQSKERELIMPTEPELVLFVALEEELDVLAKSLGLKKLAETPEALGRLDDIDVAVICPRNMGRVAAAVAMTRYLAQRCRKPKLILIVGLAGGFAENGSAKGHVIIVTKVVDLALKKLVDEEEGASPNFRREDYTLHDQLMKQILSDDLDQNVWSSQACNLGWPKDRRPSIHCGTMASADEVVASDNWRADILKGQGGEPKLLGVEMEAGGVCAAARKAGVPVSMLRVISDQADPSKADDNWRKLGMETLADLLKNLPMAKVVKALA